MFLFCFPHQSDVWALGCCVYEMSTLKHAFNARDMNSLVYRIVEGKVGFIFFFFFFLPKFKFKFVLLHFCEQIDGLVIQVLSV